LRWLVRRPVFVSVIYTALLLFGGISLTRLGVDQLPELDPPVLTVLTPYPGASALDVEEKVTNEVEEALATMAALESMRSTARDNVSITTLEFAYDTDLDRAIADIRQQLEAIRQDLPTQARDMRILQFDPSVSPIVTLAVSAEGDVRERRDEIEQLLVEPLRRVPGVGAVDLRNAPERQLRVDLDSKRLMAHGLTASEVAALLGAQNVEVPAGDIDIGNTAFAMHLSGAFDSLESLRTMVLNRSPEGGAVRLQDVADVDFGLEDSDEVVLVGEDPALIVEVRKVSGGNTVEVADRIVDLVDELGPSLPSDLSVGVLSDDSMFIKEMLRNLAWTLAVGIFLIGLVGYAFLRDARSSILMMASIPVALLLAFLVMDAFDYTLNSVTLMAMAMAVGMVVDNGVVVLENVTRHMEEGMAPLEAGAKGASEVGGALLASTTTTLVIFAPLMYIHGVIGKMFGQLAVVMIATVGASLVVALSLTPTIASRVVRPSASTARDETTWWELAYERLLVLALARPWRVVATAGALAGAVFLLVGLVGTEFMPSPDTNTIDVIAELPVGTPLERSVAVGKRIADAFAARPETELVFLRAGSNPESASSALEGPNIVRVNVQLVSNRKRKLDDEAIARQVLAAIGDMPEVDTLRVGMGGSGDIMGVSRDVHLELLGSDLEAMAGLATELAHALENIDNVVDVSADLLQTRPEVRVEVLPEQAGRLGITAGQAGQELRIAQAGVVATRYTGGSTPRDVVVSLRRAERDAPGAWEGIPVRSAIGALVPLGSITTEREAEAPLAVHHMDRARMVSVSADVVGRSTGEVGADIEKLLDGMPKVPGIQIRQGGGVESQRESFTQLGIMLAVGMVLVFLVMAAQFESLLLPLIIMFSVPFAATGGFAALLVTGTHLSATGFLGLVILVGVVVNNAIVLLDYVKQLRADGMELVEAVRLGCRRRLRPVLITSLTTAGGMIPLAVAGGTGAEIWSPMGRMALGGFLLSTLVTLVLIPVLYMLVQRVLQRVAEKKLSAAAA
jgi:HAE1 family hydrophobic/amphiphilic exporter-1